MDKTKRQLRVSGMRMWYVTHVKAECPKCGCDNRIKEGELSIDELWYSQPIYCCCERCGHEFEIEVDDDNR